MTRVELKQEAKKQLHGNWLWAAGVVAIVFIISSLISSSGIFTANIDFNDISKWLLDLLLEFILMIFVSFLTESYAITFLNLRDGKKDGVIKSAFSVFAANLFVPELLNYLMQIIFELLWTLLLIIPGAIKGYSYALTPYIVKDMADSGKKVSFTAGITASKELMRGHKWELFVLDLSFWGWYILLFGCGILIGYLFGLIINLNSYYPVVYSITGNLFMGLGGLVLAPYVQTTKANFYRNLAGEQFSK
ncbi:DUF975 family protein [Lactobacillus sp. ESL0785]|uniref:DUF975 family protein n=1 Tax=Lactobacillus sp. ESL0785 TaxID=2983232 RepID=UPI0023F6B8A3|nr:DUF975 family protein [Lactobacillus sp. ESL0785]WEV70832.1 DUF975 family protein [Lactobacillus sp. ESL0785]